MTIITISRGSYSKGREIAEKVADKLGFECVGRDVVLETSEQFHIPEIKLIRAIHNAPTILDRFGFRKEAYISFFQSAFLEHVRRDNVVYHGLAGHFFLKGISHVLKVRIIADMADRIKLEMERKQIPVKEAASLLSKDDEERRKWSQSLYGIDTHDPNLYDLVIHIRKITTDLAAEIIVNCARSAEFHATPEATAVMEDLVLAAEVKAALVTQIPYVEVISKAGVIYVRTRGHLSQESTLTNKIREFAKTVHGVKGVYVDVSPHSVSSM